MQTQQNPLILTLKLDEKSQGYFDVLRDQHFPPARNYLKAHLTLFHQLPNETATIEYLQTLRVQPFTMKVAGLKHLGAGVAYVVESPELLSLHQSLAKYFELVLIPQDRQPFKPHITIQNKVIPEASKALLAELRERFVPFEVQAIGLDLWEYLGGPWEHKQFTAFKNNI